MSSTNHSLTNESAYPAWLFGLCISQAGAVLVFLNFAGALPILQADWQLSNTQAGAIQAAGQIGYLVAVLVSSSMTDYITPKQLIIGGALWAGISNLAFAMLANGITSAVILRALVGIGVACIYMPGVKFISQNIAPSKRGGAMGLFVAAFTLGAAASIALSGTLASVLGWRLAFGLTSVGPFVGALVSVRTMPGSSRTMELKTQDVPFSELRHNRPAILVILLYVSHAWELLGLRSWLPAYLTAVGVYHGASLTAATSRGAIVAGISTLLAAAATAFVATISDRFNRIKIILLVMGVSLITITYLGFTLTLPWFVVVCVSLTAAFFANADSAVISTSLTEVVPENYLGRTLAIYSFFGFLAGSISPLLFGAALDFAAEEPGKRILIDIGSPWSLGFTTLALGSLVGLLVGFFLYRSRRYLNV